MKDEEQHDDAERRRQIQDLKRQVIRKIDGLKDPILLSSILELIEDAESDFMDAEKDPEIVEASLNERDHPGNRTKAAPINRPNKSDADSWLDGLGR
ncbi:MAG: hypothetical protein IPN95_07740 [Bacteroidetes bacterium]|jgi:hypothetical protein|nr:hypothetical protein [Bacteroidota bacterium]MBL0018672.1 hypothetical protein [Bacteroidota bacterium]MBP8074302.1 hypothetical protein [Bacteroidia bacterium]